MRKFSFHPCGNYRENYAQELNIFETDFGRLWLGIFLAVLFFVAPFVLQPLHALYSQYNRYRGHCRHRSQYSYRLYRTDFSGAWRIFRCRRLCGGNSGHTLGVGFYMAIPAAGIITALVGMIFGIPSRPIERSLSDDCHSGRTIYH